MNNGHVFISHASLDDDVVDQLRAQLEEYGISVWADDRDMSGGDVLTPSIKQGLEQAKHVLAVLSPHAINSAWVRLEIQHALQIAKQRTEPTYKVIPLLLPGIEPAALPLWFGDEPIGIRIQLGPGGLSEALPEILAALGRRSPNRREPQQRVATRPIADLLLELRDPAILTEGGKRRATATATLTYTPPEYPAARPVVSKRFKFTSPLGPIEADELRWYLERYYLWPTGWFQERAERVEADLPRWGRDLYQSALGSQAAQQALHLWRNVTDGVDRRFSVSVDSDLPEGASQAQQDAAKEAAVEVLSLPWELLHDEYTYLYQGHGAVRVRRRIPNRRVHRPGTSTLPIRLLLVSPRPEDDATGYIDHRISARPLVEALETLGELVKLTVLSPPTFPVLQQALKRAAEQGTPFDVIHFDGHGVYDRRHGLGSLCFEDPNDTKALQQRRIDPIHAEDLAAALRDHRIPLVFLEACQTAVAKENPSASVATKLLEQGVTSVVAMTHSVLVETARRFVAAFYQELARGSRVGQAMLAGQDALQTDRFRMQIMGAGELHLQDWFVPVLYQEDQDPQLFTALPSQQMEEIRQQQRQFRLGALPAPPPHTFIGRSRALLALERLLQQRNDAVVRGAGGVGKTTISVELARWLVQTNRFQRAAFVCLETYLDVRSVVDQLGRQLLPAGEAYSVAAFPDLAQALQPIERALRDQATIIILDNMESVLPDASGQLPNGAAPLEALYDLCQNLLGASSNTRLVLTSREMPPAPFNRGINLGVLDRHDAIDLLRHVMTQEGLAPKASDPGKTPEEITALVDAVDCHPRALVLLAKEVGQQGVNATTANLRQLMAARHERYPDDRDNSLYASVELSLRRLSPEVREQLKPLAVFHGGAHLGIWAPMLGVEDAVIADVARAVVDAGLSEGVVHGHLRLDPALPSYLQQEMDEASLKDLKTRWAADMQAFVAFLDKQRLQDAVLNAKLAHLEMLNILDLLNWMQDNAAAEQVVTTSNTVEMLFSRLGLQQALAQSIAIRKKSAAQLTEWSHAWFLAESAHIDRLIENNDSKAAHIASEQLLKRCLEASKNAYDGSDYDIARAYYKLGNIKRDSGAIEEALTFIEESLNRLQALVDSGSNGAEYMISSVLMTMGDCLAALRRFNEAAAVYEKIIQHSEASNRTREIAVGQGQLATIRREQRRYDEALQGYDAAKKTFEALGELGSLAIIWHQSGLVYKDTQQFEQAEYALKQALSIDVQQQNRMGEADSLTALSSLYAQMGRPEAAVAFIRQAIDIYVELQHAFREGMARHNLADLLCSLQRYHEARGELNRAIDCRASLGHAAELWTTWGLLDQLEQAAENPFAAAEARRQGIAAYLAHRRDGGENQNPGAQLSASVLQAIQQGDTAERHNQLEQYLRDHAVPWAIAMIPKLQAILDGDRDSALANDPELDYDDAAELLLLLEHLGEQEL